MVKNKVVVVFVFAGEVRSEKEVCVCYNGRKGKKSRKMAPTFWKLQR